MLENDKLRRKENERRRRSLLIFGNANMSLKNESLSVEQRMRKRI